MIILAAAVWGCSANINKENADAVNINVKSAVKKLALEKFIQGSIYESKGQYADAVGEFLEAAKFDAQPGVFYALAKNYFRLNKLSSSLKFAKEACAGEPNNIEYLQMLASVYSASLLADSSIGVYEKIIKIDSTNAAAYFQLAQLYEAKRPNQALDYYKKVIDLIGPEWTVLVRLVDLNERMGNIDETIKMVEELIKLNPSDLQLQKVLIDSYIKTKKYDMALKVADEALISFPDDLGLLELKGNVYLQQSKWPNAFNEYVKLVRDKSVSFDNKIKIGSLFLAAVEKDSSNLDYAFKMFSEIDKDSSDWQVNAYLGEIQLREKNDSLAIGYFKKAASLAEWNAQLWARLGGVLFDNKKYDEAIKFMDQAAVKFPNDFVINLIYGLALAQENKHDDAIIYLKRAQNINPNDLTVLSALGYSLNQLKQDDEALKLLNQALIVEPDNIQIIGQTALIYESRKNYQVSDSLYLHALKIDSSYALILNNYAYSLSERGIKLEDALKMSERAVKSEPNNSSYLDTIGWIYFMLGDYNKAKDNIERSLQYDPKNATVIDHLGDVYFKLGDKKKALENWKKANELDPANEKYKSKIEKGVI